MMHRVAAFAWLRRPLYTAAGIALLALMLFPVYWMVNASLQKSGNTLSTELFPMAPNLDGYVRAITEQGANLITSLVVSLCTVALSLAIAAPAAYALARLRGRWVDAILFAILVSQMIPGIVIANALYPAYNSLHLLNSIPGLVLADATAGIPFAILLMRSFMLGLPPSLVEAACVDGAGPIRTFVSIVVPVSRNAIITAGLFTFLFAWSDFLFALTLTTTKAVRPVTLGIYQYLGTQVSNWQSIMATAVVSSLPAIILLLVAQRFITAGALGGSTK
ncbi:carbohydrate ABC transporter permease [Verminephrobacter aporrectodeae subsp. tuberculatae]|uniref:carbohydrate ABC transporter permease n=2 Tax=Verminephrobacter aporrectodeae TaxID=1110389 RepID=UPI0022436831|nr:carbohydrate ABC transporter permease [Verminephrobacter aporrectodeae]MCW5221375.1 carbohydrate ABC transporter permease [Verminephrobacter aporrectodeae subsp. tuberculatae]MCW5257686.1 carbohydrate ABC transporter permease [Verminephrobacter aporrectodeae subsp. tuberculatae]MCW5290666.1 carbohydrate ABC transporter permease [Verminephrobacter aporrectodeae subsp. tuberculatae]MCW8166609.1 carbohydrate ABC transporter permease [Verminephrobacter aporrectodeae subsp. tuberculatae]MCW81707